jgi:hypothetical protein
MDANSLTYGSLSIALWNANGILRHLDELDAYLHNKRIDIALISETHLTSRTRCFVNNYKIYRTDHPDDTAHGGTAVIVKSNLIHFPKPSISLPHFQACSVIVRTRHKDITLGAVYCPPRFIIQKDTFSSLLKSFGNCFVIGGDFNAKHVVWGSRLCTPRGRQLQACLLENNMHPITPFSPTYWPASPRRLPDILDFYIQKGLTNVPYDIDVVHDLSSDHTPVQLTLWAEYKLSSTSTLICGEIDWEEFRNSLDHALEIPLSLKTDEEIENAVEYFTTSVQSSAWFSTTPKCDNRMPKYPQYIRDLIREKRRARKRWHNSRLTVDKQSYNRLNNLLKSQLRTLRNERREENLSQLSASDGSLWKKCHQILGSKMTMLPLKKDSGDWAITNEEKSEVFADHLQSTFQPHADVQDIAHDLSVTSFLDCPLQLSLPPKAFSPSEIKYVIDHLPKNKAPGYDLITSNILQQLPRKGIMFLTSIFNSILRTTSFPVQWKYSNIVMILKPNKNPYSYSSYRPISLLPVCAKVFEKLFLKRLLSFIPSDCIPQHQFGFRESHSTTHQLHRVTDFIASSLERKLYSSGVFLDVSQAFDRVWLDGLFFKLKTLVPHSYYLILKSLLSERYFSVKLGSSLSSIRPSMAGVPQGSVLSPLLYTIYTSDFPAIQNCMVATFADDTAILSSDKDADNVSRNLQHFLNQIETWCTKWKIKLNTTKSQHVTFTLRRQTCPPVYFNNVPIPQTTSVKYLGLTFDRRLTWNPHTRLKRVSLNTRLKALYALLHRRSPVPLSQKLKCYTYLIRPLWTYGAQIYGSAKHSNINRIQAFQNKFLRLITNSPSYVRNSILHRDLRIDTVHTTIQKLYRRFYSKLLNHANPEIQQLSRLHLPHNPRRRLKRRWNRDLLQ